MAAMRFKKVPRFILGKKMFWGQGHFKYPAMQLTD